MCNKFLRGADHRHSMRDADRFRYIHSPSGNSLLEVTHFQRPQPSQRKPLSTLPSAVMAKRRTNHPWFATGLCDRTWRQADFMDSESYPIALSYLTAPSRTVRSPVAINLIQQQGPNFPFSVHKYGGKVRDSWNIVHFRTVKIVIACARKQRVACTQHLDGYSRHFHCFLKHLHGAAVQTSSSLTSLDLCQDAIAPIATAISVRTGMEESCVLKEAYANASLANACYEQNNWKTADFSLSRLN